MSDTHHFWLLLTGVLSLVGCGWLALAMEPHWRQVHGARARRPAAVVAMRVLGGLAIACAAASALHADRPSMALLVWVMLVSGGAFTVAQLLAWRPKLLGLLWPACGSRARHIS